ncbi:MAG: MFS transporter [Deltaproteobacteria bacterium]|nr:MFS transporter [Deltaproteobacteria bacterium]
MRPRFFYGYVILSLCFLNMFFLRGVIASFAVFYIALIEEFQWSHATVASVASANAVVYAMACPLIGWSFDRFGPRILMPVGGALIGFGLLISGLSHSIWALYFSYGILAGAGQAGLGFVSQSALISHWFLRRRGTAVGIAAMGMGLGALILVPLSQMLIAQLGWRAAFMVLAGLGLITVVPANAVFQRRSPDQVGQYPDGVEEPPAQSSPHSSRSPSGGRQWTMASAARSFPFWAITVSHLALGIGLAMFYTHAVAYLVDQGFEKLVSASIFGTVGLMRFGGTMFWGYVSDRLGRTRTFGISTTINAIGLLFLLAVSPNSPHWFAYAFAILFGIGHSAGNPISAATIADIFSGNKIGTIYGFLEISFGVGMALGAWLGGYGYDMTGSYRWAFTVGLLSFIVSYLCIRLSMAWHQRDLLSAKADSRMS